MKKADLEKLKGKSITGRQGAGTTSDRFGKGAADVVDKREQRRRDQAAGLVPFAVKLHGDLVKQLQDLAQAKKMGLNEAVDEILRKGLAKK